jgi:hypothetical protein
MPTEALWARHYPHFEDVGTEAPYASETCNYRTARLEFNPGNQDTGPAASNHLFVLCIVDS